MLLSLTMVQIDFQQSNSKVTRRLQVDGGSVTPSKMDPTRLRMNQSTPLDLLESSPEIINAVIVCWQPLLGSSAIATSA